MSAGPVGNAILGYRPIRVGTVYAVGRNYARHAAEMGEKAEPVVFLKPASSVVAGGRLDWPTGCRELHHEVELVALLSSGGIRLSVEQARAAIAGIGIGVDLTARDVQSEAKRLGRPWAASKGFAGAAPISPLCPVRDDLLDGAIDLELKVDGEVRQAGSTESMIFPLAELISWLSQTFVLAESDLIFTGTPEGVGPIEPGQVVRAVSLTLATHVEFSFSAATDPTP